MGSVYTAPLEISKTDDVEGRRDQAGLAAEHREHGAVHLPRRGHAELHLAVADRRDRHVGQNSLDGAVPAFACLRQYRARRAGRRSPARSTSPARRRSRSAAKSSERLRRRSSTISRPRTGRATIRSVSILGFAARVGLGAPGDVLGQVADAQSSWPTNGAMRSGGGRRTHGSSSCSSTRTTSTSP